MRASLAFLGSILHWSLPVLEGSLQSPGAWALRFAGAGIAILALWGWGRDADVIRGWGRSRIAPGSFML